MPYRFVLDFGTLSINAQELFDYAWAWKLLYEPTARVCARLLSGGGEGRVGLATEPTARVCARLLGGGGEGRVGLATERGHGRRKRAGHQRGHS